MPQVQSTIATKPVDDGVMAEGEARRGDHPKAGTGYLVHLARLAGLSLIL